MKAYIEKFGRECYIGEIVHDDEYTPRGGIGDIKPEFAYKVVSKTEIALSWKDEPIASIRTREVVGYADEYMCVEISDDEYNEIIASGVEKEQDALKAEIEELEAKIEAVNPDELPTYEEARAKEREWNDTYNEGGYGYVPHYVDKDEYARAVKKLEELKKGLKGEGYNHADQ